MLSVLIADDDGRRSEMLSGAIRDAARAVSDVGVDITLVQSTAEARRELFGGHYDLAIIDVVLPTYGGSQPRASGGLSLIEELLNTSLYKRPSFIVGISAFESAASEAARAHDDIVWKVLNASEFEHGWVGSIQRLVEHIISIDKKQADARIASIDVAWVTALRSPEFEAVQGLSWGWTRALPIDTGLYYYAGTVPGNRLAVGAVCCLRMGAVEASLVTGRTVQALRPRVAVMSGICAGIRGLVELGDVVVATQAWDWQSGKLTAGGRFEPDPVAISSSEMLLAKFQQLQADPRWAEDTWNGFVGSKPEQPPRIHLGPLATGSPVVADDGIVEKITRLSRKTLGIDMEAYGFYAACAKSASPHLDFCTIKGVCDFADPSKNDGLQAYAAYVSARAVAAVLEGDGWLREKAQ